MVTIGAGTVNRLTTAVGNIEPGDVVYRPIDLLSTATLLSSVTGVRSPLEETTWGSRRTIDGWW